MRKLIVYTAGGLSNRIFSVASGIEFAKMNGRELLVYWPVDRAMPAKFNELYQEEIMIVDEDFLNRLDDSETKYHSQFMDTVQNDYNFFGREFLRNKFRQGHLVIGEAVNDIDVENICFTSNTFLRTVSREASENRLRNLRIVNDCLQTIEEFTKISNLDKTVIGVHIRGTDFHPNLNYHINKIKDILQNSNQKFLLCSDDEIIERTVLNMFPNNMIFRPNKKYVNSHFDSNNNVSRGNAETIKDGLVDLYLLAKTDFKIYEERSTYASYAKILSN